MADAGMRIVVEGEKEFKAALSQIDTAVKNNQKSLRLLTAEYELQGQGIRALTENEGDLMTAQDALRAQEEKLGKQGDVLVTKGKVLADSIAEQTEKVDLLDLRVGEAAKAYGEHDKRTEALRGQLLDASTALAKMTLEAEKNQAAIAANRKAIEDNKTAQLDAEHSTRAYEEEIARLTASVSANQAEVKALEAGNRSLETENASLGKSTEDLRKKSENLAAQNEKLQAAGDRLRDSVDKQKSITENLAKAQEETVKRYGEGSKEAEAYRKRLADATTQLDRMETELKENERAVEENNKAIEDGGSAPNGMIQGLEKVEELTGIKIPAGIKDMIGGFDDGALAVSGIVGILGTVAAKMADIFQDTMKWSRDLTTESQELDLGTEEYQALQYAATKAGVDTSAFAAIIKGVTDKVGDSNKVLGDYVGHMEDLQYADAETKKAVAAEMKYWDDLGVSIYDADGNLKNTHDLIFDLIAAFENMDEGVERSNKMMDLFGSQYKKVNPLVKTGADNLRAFEEEAYRTGAVLTEDTVNSLNNAGAAFDTLKFRAGAATKQMIVDISGVNKETKTFGQTLKDFFGKAWLGPLLGVGEVVKGAAKWFGTTLGYADGTDFAPGGLALVGERGPEIVSLPRGSAVYPHGTMPPGMSSTANTYNITIDARNVKEFNDIIRYAQGARVAVRRG